MTRSEKLVTIAENQQRVYDAGYSAGQRAGDSGGYDEGYSAGQKAEYDHFWESYQNGGERKAWDYAFYGDGWTDDVYKPKYPITGAIASMFRGNKVTNTIVPIIATSTTSNAFSYSSVDTIPSIDFTNASAVTNCFNNASKLKNLTVVGTISTNINLQQSPLTIESMKSVIAALVNHSGTSNANTQCIYFSEDCWAALEADSTAPNGETWRSYVTNVLAWNT